MWETVQQRRQEKAFVFPFVFLSGATRPGFVFMIVLERYKQIYLRLLPTFIHKDQYFQLLTFKKHAFFM